MQKYTYKKCFASLQCIQHFFIFLKAWIQTTWKGIASVVRFCRNCHSTLSPSTNTPESVPASLALKTQIEKLIQVIEMPYAQRTMHWHAFTLHMKKKIMHGECTMFVVGHHFRKCCSQRQTDKSEIGQQAPRMCL